MSWFKDFDNRGSFREKIQVSTKQYLKHIWNGFLQSYNLISIEDKNKYSWQLSMQKKHINIGWDSE